MFPGYLFVHHAMDKHGYVQVLQARGVVRILGERWDRLAPVDDAGDRGGSAAGDERRPRPASSAACERGTASASSTVR